MLKRFMSILLACLLLFPGFALADDTGITIIGGPEVPAEAVSLDDFKVGDTTSVSGYGDVTLLSAVESDLINCGDAYRNAVEWVFTSDKFESGGEATYLRLDLSILNTQHSAYNYMAGFGDVICEFGDGYQFGGWFRQEHMIKDGDYTIWLPYQSADESYPVETLYEGRYMIVVTLPEYVIQNEKEPLSVTFHLGDSEFTYWHHRQ